MKYDTKQPWQRLIRLLKLERRDIFQIFGYAIFSGLISLSLPIGVQAIINLIQGARITTSWVVLVCLVTLGVIFSGVLQLMQMRILESIQQRIFTRASFELAYRFPKMCFERIRGYYPPELANRFFDTLTIQKGLPKLLIDIPFALLQIFFALLILSFYNPFFIIFGFALVVIFYFTFRYTIRKGIATSLKESKQKYKVAHWIQEIARVAISFKTSGNTQFALEKNDVLVGNYLRARENHFKVLVLQFIKMIGFKATVSLGLLIIGGLLVLNQQMNIGQFVASEIIILLIINSVEKIISGLETIYDTLTSIEKLGQITDIDLDLQHGKTPDLSAGFDIELQGITHTVPMKMKPVIENLSYHFRAGHSYVITGRIASGKSTISKIISGLITPTQGHIFIAQTPLSQVATNHYRSYVSTSFSEETPFEGTLRENLTFNNVDITEEKIVEMLEIFGLKSFLRTLPEGLETVLCAEGKYLSDSIARRIILLRAVLRPKKWLVLENPLAIYQGEELEKVANYLTAKQNDFGLIVASNHSFWQGKLDGILTL